MYSFLTKKGQTIAFVIGAALSLLFIVMVLSSSEGVGADMFAGMSPAERQEKLVSLKQFDLGLYVTYVLFVLIVVLTIGFGLFQFVKNIADNPKSAIQTAVMVGGIVILYFIGGAMAGEDSTGVLKARQAFQVSDGISNFVSGSINLSFLLLLLSLVILVVLEVRNAFK